MTNIVNNLLMIPFAILRLILPWLLLPMALFAIATSAPGFIIPFLAVVGVMTWLGTR